MTELLRTLMLRGLAGACFTLTLCADVGAQPAADTSVDKSAGNDAAKTPMQQVAGLWRIVQARTEPMLDKRFASLEFGAGGRLGGHTSCNPLSAEYVLIGDRLTVRKITTENRTCPRLQLEQEDRVLSALEAAKTARVRPDGLLELRDADGRGVLRATRFDVGQ